MFWIKRVDELVVSGEMDGEYLTKHFRKDYDYKVIKNLPPFKSCVKSNLIREKFNIPNDIPIVLYQGMYLPGRGLDLLAETAALYKGICYFLLGYGEYEAHLKKRIEELHINDNFILAGKVDYSQLHNWTCSADIGVSLFEPISYSYELALPNKLFEYAMAGLPVIVSDLPAQRKVLEEFNYGSIVPTDITAGKLLNTITQIFERKEQYSKVSREAAKIYCYENQLEILKSIFH